MRRGDFDRLYAEHAAAMYAFLAYRTGDDALAQHLLADTFERALRARGRFDPRRASEKTWLYAIALNLLRDHVRRAGAERRAVERLAGEVRTGATGVPAPDADAAQRDELRAALATLTEEEREAIALRYGAGLTAKEIARVTGEKATTAEGRVYRALRKLRAALEDV
jgi:RNA polymerase sigma-70 factor (ECF subfamily)